MQVPKGYFFLIVLICRAYFGMRNIIGAQEILGHNKWACIISVMIKMFASLILEPVSKLLYVVKGKGELNEDGKWVDNHQCWARTLS